MENIKLGDWYYTDDGYGDVAGYLFVARQGDFIIGVPEYFGCDTALEQLEVMHIDTLDDDGVNMYVHKIDRCYTTLEDAEKYLVDEMTED